jgi:hypothetical protein
MTSSPGASRARLAAWSSSAAPLPSTMRLDPVALRQQPPDRLGVAIRIAG